jgi:hypothetical protein
MHKLYLNIVNAYTFLGKIVLIDEEIIRHLPKSYQLFYELYKQAKNELLKEEEFE